MSTGTTLLYNRKFGYTLITFCLVSLHVSHLSEGRGIPPRSRSNSKSFRFPNSVEDTFQDSSATLLLATHTENQDKTQSDHFGRNAIISLDSNPVKPAVPLSPKNEDKNEQSNNITISAEQTLSSEIIGADLDIPTDDNNMNNEDYEKNGPKEDEALREVLCPPSTATVVGSNASTTVNSHETGIVVSSTDFEKLRYDLRAGKCAELGKKEHCGENMIFIAEIDSAAYGYCECDFENKIMRREEKQAALFSRTPLVYHLSSNSCYRLYEQAYCNDNEWLVLSREAQGPVCEQRKCSPGQEKVQLTAGRALESRRRTSKLLTPAFWTNSSPEKAKIGNSSENSITRSRKESIWVPLNGSGPCVKLFENNPQYCEQGEQVVPTCGVLGRGIEGRAIVRNACPPGSYYSIIGRCQPDWDF